VSKDEAEYFDAKIKQLKPKELSVTNKNILITHSLHLTMVDGKVCNAIILGNVLYMWIKANRNEQSTKGFEKRSSHKIL